MKKFALLLIASSLVASCAKLDDKKYATPGQPESLIDFSSEKVFLSVATKEGLNELKSYLNKDIPTSAQLSCDSSTKECKEAERLLNNASIPFEHIDPSDKIATNNIVLTYDKVITKDCDNLFVSNNYNFYNLNHPAFGCSVSANMIQMISDTQQIIEPLISGPQDAVRPAKEINNLYYPRR